MSLFHLYQKSLSKNKTQLKLLAAILLLSLQCITKQLNVHAMRLVVQRVKSASVSVRGKGKISSIGPGIVALVGIHQNDTEDNLKVCCKKLLAAKLWENDDGKPWR